MQQEHRIVAHIRCPPEGEEDDIALRLRDAGSYRVWVTVECKHVQPGALVTVARCMSTPAPGLPSLDAHVRARPSMMTT